MLESLTESEKKAGEEDILSTEIILSGERDYRSPGRLCGGDMI